MEVEREADRGIRKGGADEVAQQVETPDINLEYPGSIPKAHVIEGEN